MVASIHRMKTIAILAAALTAAALAHATAATGVVGGLSSAVFGSIGGVTLIDISRPASTSGNYDSATVLWTGGPGAPCASAFKIKFYRPSFAGSPDMTFVDERGPFDAHRGLVTVSLSPPVALLAGDLIAVTELAAASCGEVALTDNGGGAKVVSVTGEITSETITICDGDSTLSAGALDAIATAGGTEVRSGIVTGVGSVHGASNSNFKTAMQLMNPGPAAIEGRLVFHPILQSGSASDPSLPYSIAPIHAISIADVVEAMGTSGLGSIDVIANASYPPLVVTRVFNDAGAAGTAGFTEPAVRSGDQYVLQPNDVGYLLAPADLVKYRMNIGVRTLGEAVSLGIEVFDGTTGVNKLATSRDYPPDFFDQRPVADFLNGLNISANDIIEVQPGPGRAIVYGASVDNVTNDTSLQLATRTGF